MSGTEREQQCNWNDPDDFKYQFVDEDVAAEEFLTYLVLLKVSGKLSAKQACILAFWACKAGAKGAKKLAVRPDAPSGRFSYEFDNAMGSFPKDLPSYSVDLAKRRRHDNSRSWEPLPFIPPHEAIAKELDSSTEASEQLRYAKEGDELPRIFTENPLVSEAPADVEVHPLAIYMDGVQHNRTDSVLGIWCYLLLTGKRHLLGVIRKSELCACGCRGWCSLAPIFRFLSWSLGCMARGAWPTARHDGQPWRPEDKARQTRAGAPFGWRVVVAVVKGDWAEYSHSLGLPSHADGIAPCPWCFTSPDQMYEHAGLSIFGPPFPRKSAADYDAACRHCEIEKVLTKSDVDAIRFRLKFDKRLNGARGRAVATHCPEVGLLANDRLEPSVSLPDVASLEDQPFPVRTLWWRRDCETSARHRNPLFGEESGLSVHNLGIDWMHTLSLGVHFTVIMNFVWELISANPWGIVGPTASIVELGFSRLKGELSSWYTSTPEGRQATRIQHFTSKLCGTYEQRSCKLHASESNGFLLFARTALDRHGTFLGGRQHAYRDLMDSLIMVVSLIKEHPRKFDVDAAQCFVDQVCKHMRALRALQLPFRPKHHLLIEMGGRFSFGVIVTPIFLAFACG